MTRFVEFNLLGTTIWYDDLMILAAHRILRDTFDESYDIFLDSDPENNNRYFVRVIRPDGERFRFDGGTGALGLPEHHDLLAAEIKNLIEMIKGD